MNKINFQQTGGFPLETDTLEALQTAYSIFNALGELAGNFGIISGCTTSGSTASDGVVHINGEVLNFQGGSRSSYVIIKEDVDTRVFEDGQSKVVYHQRYVTFGSASQRYAWSAFKRIKSVQALEAEKETKLVVSSINSRLTIAESNISKKADKTALTALTTTVNNLAKKVMPIGGIIMWSGSLANIPTGWALCNGANGTPNLEDRFIVGAGGSYNIGATGGSKDVTLNEAQIPAHKHSGTTSSGGNHRHGYSIREDEYGSGNGASLSNTSGTNEGLRSFFTDYAGTHTHSFTTGEQGGGQAHENRPPYYALAFIMFKG